MTAMYDSGKLFCRDYGIFGSFFRLAKYFCRWATPVVSSLYQIAQCAFSRLLFQLRSSLPKVEYPSLSNRSRETKRRRPEITIMYWPFLGRASGLFRMLEEANIEYEHVSDVGQMCFAISSDDETTNLAPPIILDMNKGLTISQAVACHSYIGNKYGFDKGITVTQVAMQYMLDLDDLHNELLYRALKDRKEKTVTELQKYVTGNRYKNHLKAINRSIRGPFYFGQHPTYVDFAVCSYLDKCIGKWLAPLERKAGDTIGHYAPKLKAVYEHISSLPSASKLGHLPLVPPRASLSSAQVETWQEEDKRSYGPSLLE
eukprot:scaffold1323_cov160-Amphora_coffeaeformis.AAC.12